MALTRGGRRAVVATAVIGAGLALAPVAFQMFSRAPQGGTMLDEFRPYMDEQTIGDFQGWMAEIGAAEAEVRSVALPALESLDGADAADAPVESGDLAGLDRFVEAWPAIDGEMGDMLTDMEASLDNFAAVDALPPFPLFPWFFVLPGVITLSLAVAAWRSERPQRLLAALAAVGIGLIAAPAIFQMFTRAPEGKEMIDTFRPLMTREKVTRVQGYFLTLGSAEGDLRNRVLPALEGTGTDLPATERWVADWPTISSEMAPMIGAMADNLDNYAAVDALPPFSLFPWFFVAPGVLVSGAALWAHRRGTTVTAATSPDPTPATTSVEPTPEPTRSAP